MEQEVQRVDIEGIMRKIREEAEKLRYEEPVSFEDVEIPAVMTEKNDRDSEFSLKKAEQTLDHINAMWEIPYGHVINGNPLKKLLARLARKINKPTGAPMAEDITKFNAEATQGMNEIMKFIRGALKKEDEMSRRIFELETEIRQLKKSAGKKA